MRSPAGGHGGRNNDIEVLRAYAVLLTIVCHSGNLVHWNGTWSNRLGDLQFFWGGVDLFFCISGFVITQSLLRQGEADSFSQQAIPFYLRRIFRIWPAALLWLLLPLLAARYFNELGAFGHPREDLSGSAAAALQVSNFYQMICSHGSGAHLPCGKAEVYWSLSLEEQFYLIFPVLLYFLGRASLKRVLVAVILLQIFLPRVVETPLWFVRTDAISLGVLIALAQADGRLRAMCGRIRTARARTSWLALVLIGAVAALSTAEWLEINTGLLALAAAGLVLIASADADLILPLRHLRPLLLWAGSRSYAMYLVHNPSYWATREIFHRLFPHAVLNDSWTIPFVLTGLALVALSAEATYQLVETPLRAVGRKLASGYEGRVRSRVPAIPAPMPTPAMPSPVPPPAAIRP